MARGECGDEMKKFERESRGNRVSGSAVQDMLDERRKQGLPPMPKLSGSAVQDMLDERRKKGLPPPKG